jgi:hypothetical protein
MLISEAVAAVGKSSRRDLCGPRRVPFRCRLIRCDTAGNILKKEKLKDLRLGDPVLLISGYNSDNYTLYKNLVEDKIIPEVKKEHEMQGSSLILAYSEVNLQHWQVQCSQKIHGKSKNSIGAPPGICEETSYFKH